MIQTVYHRQYHRLTMEGHALRAEPGQDLVCAAATILVYTLADRVQQMAENGQVRQPVVILEPGRAEVCCNPRHSFRGVVTLVFDSVCAGFEILAGLYPENIHWEIR